MAIVLEFPIVVVVVINDRRVRLSMTTVLYSIICRKDRKKRDKDERTAYKLEQEIAMWDPTTMEESTTDPFKTLFVARINFYTSESKLKREFESYGPIKSIKMIKDESGKPKGYCFIEYEHERDMHCKYCICEQRYSE